MISEGIRTKMIAAALLMTTVLGAPALADPWNGHESGAGYASGDSDYRDAENGAKWNAHDNDYGNEASGKGFHNGDSYDQGHFNFGGNFHQRLKRVEYRVRYMTQSGELNRWQAHRAFDMLRSVGQQASYVERDGNVSQRERANLNSSLDRLVTFLRDSRSNRQGYGYQYGHDDRDRSGSRDYNY